jgi:hypothetical protein
MSYAVLAFETNKHRSDLGYNYPVQNSVPTVNPEPYQEEERK